MAKIIDEIIENIPDLEKDKVVLEKTINFLDENKPEIKIDKDFKMSLKSRIDWLVSIKSWSKSKFTMFAIPVFSFVFAIWWFMFYFKDLIFLVPDNNSSFIWTDWENIKIGEIEEVWKILDNEINSLLEEKNNSANISSENISSRSLMMWTRSINSRDELIQEPESLNDSGVNILSDVIDEEPTISLDSEMNISSDESIETFSISSEPMLLESVYLEEKELTFWEYCSEIWWDLSREWAIETCTLEDKKCSSDTFESWVCEFEEIK